MDIFAVFALKIENDSNLNLLINNAALFLACSMYFIGMHDVDHLSGWT